MKSHNDDSRLQEGVTQALRNCVRLQQGEKVVIVTDTATTFIAYELEWQAGTIAGRPNVQTFYMEIFGKRPDNLSDGHVPLALPQEIEEALRGADVAFYAALTKPGELKSFRSPMIEVVNSNRKLRYAHMPGVTLEVFMRGMAVDYGIVQKVTARVKERVERAQNLYVTTPAGTDVVAEFLPAYRWIASDGNIVPGHWMNLPTGETYTYPVTVNGVVVVDGVLGDHFDRKYGAFAATPVRLRIVNGVVTDVACGNKELEKELKKYMDSDSRGNQIGEFGIGTNIGLDGVVGNMLLDEKHPGVHLAVGDPYGSKTGAPWKSSVHCDGVLLKTTIVADGEVIMKDGKFDEKYLK